MSNASSIFTEARSKISTLLGPSYKEHTNIFDTEDLATVTLDNGYSVLLIDVDEKSPQVNKNFIERSLKITVTHRTFASVDAGKVIVKLATVYDKEAAIIDEIRCWSDPTIGMIKALPKTTTKVEQMYDGEDSFIVNTLNFVILYIN